MIFPLIGKDNITNPSNKFFFSITNGRISLHDMLVELSGLRVLMIEIEEVPSLGMTFQNIFIG
jgi:hypothetical protein